MRPSIDTLVVLLMVVIVVGSLLCYLTIQPNEMYHFTPKDCPNPWDYT